MNRDFCEKAYAARVRGRAASGRILGFRSSSLLLAAVAAAWPVGVANGQTDAWIDGTGNWSNPGNWSAGVPGAGEDINILETDGVGRVINYDYAGAAALLDSLMLGLTNAMGTASSVLMMVGNTLAVTNLYVGDSGSGNSGVGTFIQSGGVNVVGGSRLINAGTLYLGYNSKDTGTYILSSTGSLAANGFTGLVGTEIVGFSGDGQFNQSGGTNNAVGIDLAYNLHSTGIYTLSGTGKLVALDETIGDFGTGVFNQSGGSNTSTGNFTLTDIPGSTGIYYPSGNGTLKCAGETIGSGGTAIFNQSGGINTDSFSLEVGSFVVSTATYILSGTGSLTANGEGIGSDGDIQNLTGIFNQSGGSNRTPDLTLGSSLG